MSKNWSGQNNPGFKHGHYDTPEHRSWKHMLRRCYDKNDIRFPRYGGRGISVCAEWRDDFERFLADMGKKPKGHSLHRSDNDKNYCVTNCMWADAKMQQRNRSGNRLITAFGVTAVLTEWAEITGIKVGTLWARLDNGWTTVRAVTVPVRRITL